MKLQVSLPEKFKIAREWRRQGCPGALSVVKARPDLRARAVREVVAGLKLKSKDRHRKIKEEVRKTVIVLHAGTVIAMDGATIKKGEDVIVYRDRKMISTHSENCNGPAKAQSTLGVLEKLKSGNRLPLVLCTDNGSPFCAISVETFLKENHVVHLKSLPHVPQHNGSGESAVKDLKHVMRAGYTALETCVKLNENRLRPKLNFKTSQEVENESLKIYTIDERIKFFTAARSAIDSAVSGTQSAYGKRKAERKAIHDTMENFSLITIITGRHPA